MALFSRISTFFSPSLSVLTTIALATAVMGIDIVGKTEEKAPRNFWATHSAGLLSSLSTKSTLEKNNHIWNYDLEITEKSDMHNTKTYDLRLYAEYKKSQQILFLDSVFLEQKKQRTYAGR